MDVLQAADILGVASLRHPPGRHRLQRRADLDGVPQLPLVLHQPVDGPDIPLCRVLRHKGPPSRLDLHHTLGLEQPECLPHSATAYPQALAQLHLRRQLFPRLILLLLDQLSDPLLYLLDNGDPGNGFHMPHLRLSFGYVIVFILQPDTLYVKDFFLLYDNYCSLYDIFLFSSPIPSSCQGRKKRLQ